VIVLTEVSSDWRAVRERRVERIRDSDHRAVIAALALIES
jgi:hypothetical protein